MTFSSEKEMDAFLTEWMRRKFPRGHPNQHFLATIVTATARATFGFLCMVTMPGETVAVGPFLSPQVAANYTPAVGHVVMCEWTDESSAVIQYRVS